MSLATVPIPVVLNVFPNQVGHLTKFIRVLLLPLIQPLIKPQRARQTSRNSIEQKGKILLVIPALNNQVFCNIREAARVYNVTRTTPQRRFDGITSRVETRANGHKLTQDKEYAYTMDFIATATWSASSTVPYTRYSQYSSC